MHPTDFVRSRNIHETIPENLSEKVKRVAKGCFSWVISSVKKTIITYGADLGGMICMIKIIGLFGLDLRVENPLLRMVGLTMHTKYVKIWNVVDDYLYPRLFGQHYYQMPPIFQLYSNAFLEEVFDRGLIQKIVLPLLSKPFPSRIRNILNHKVTRIILSSILFSIGHTGCWNQKNGVSVQFMGGLVYGTAAEFDSSLLVPITAHFLFNFTDQLSSLEEFYILISSCVGIYALCKFLEILCFSEDKQTQLRSLEVHAKVAFSTF